MTVEYCVISIGALSHNRLWSESAPLRTAHATTTLVTDGDRRILVDPSLPSMVLAARFNERTGMMPGQVSDVFCTTLRPVHRRSLEALPHAAWWANGPELEAYRQHLEKLGESSRRLESGDAAIVEADLKLLRHFKAAPERFSQQVHLYPLIGPSVGSAGLLLATAAATIVIAGDAALTAEHVLRGRVWEGCADAEAAMDSLKDLLELADVIVPGHDNIMLSPRQGF